VHDGGGGDGCGGESGVEWNRISEHKSLHSDNSYDVHQTFLMKYVNVTTFPPCAVKKRAKFRILFIFHKLLIVKLKFN
jgi:hypothetical protein